jgi:hypothetical protein
MAEDNHQTKNNRLGAPTAQGYSPTEEELEKVEVRIGRREVFFFLGGLAAVLGVGALVWKGAEYYFQSRQYQNMADKAVDGLDALNTLANTINDMEKTSD